MSSDIPNMVDNCSICQEHQRCNTKSTIVTKDVPDLPFERVASDLFHFRGAEYLVIVDSYSNFFDFKRLTEPTSEAVISSLKKWFSVHGIPRILETDNGPQYASSKFRQFAEEWNIEHRTSSPHFPRANGLAERFVQVSKNILKKCTKDGSDINLAMLHARNTPRNESIPSPNERLMGRLVRSNLPTTKDMLAPKVVTKVKEAIVQERQQQKAYADRGARVPRAYSAVCYLKATAHRSDSHETTRTEVQHWKLKPPRSIRDDEGGD
nr:uncharacterized protein K02A2.6-like [Aedes albopictus]